MFNKIIVIIITDFTFLKYFRILMHYFKIYLKGF